MTAETNQTPKDIEVTAELLDNWATDPKGPVALHLKQKLLSVEGDGGVIFPPTYADIGYNIDTLSDGTKVATVDSVGSQANRLEPIFKAAPGQTRDKWLVPQIEIVLHEKKSQSDCGGAHREKRSILDLAHRAADAVVQSSPTLSAEIARAFETLRRTGDAGPLCTIAPTSLVFGVWDSRGGTGEKRPRLVRSVIRAWDVESLHAAAQFNSIWKVLDDTQRSELEKEAKTKKTKLSEKGFADAPAIFRKVGTSAAKYMQEFRDGVPNPDRRVLGGVLAKGRIERDVTINLVALRGLRGADDAETAHIRTYLLGLALVAATADIELFLREGCHLRYEGADAWSAVPRRGEPDPLDLCSDKALVLVHAYAAANADWFRPKWTMAMEHLFDLKEAKKLLAKKGEDQPGEE